MGAIQATSNGCFAGFLTITKIGASGPKTTLILESIVELQARAAATLNLIKCTVLHKVRLALIINRMSGETYAFHSFRTV